MKTRIATVMLLLGIFIASTAFASEPMPANSLAKKEVKNLIQKKLIYPQFAIDNKIECSVYLNLLINENGMLEVNCANCSCEKVKDFTVKYIEKIKSEDLQNFKGQSMNLKVTYDLR
ncbi:MAG: hypothetical protein C0595_11325 [Marinilabiliales bacterium]|nr:MAG: hypothetical protein C0595_11325 [Marinilabiliales bacterium]